jgi:hypothetical protein
MLTIDPLPNEIKTGERDEIGPPPGKIIDFFAAQAALKAAHEEAARKAAEAERLRRLNLHAQLHPAADRFTDLVFWFAVLAAIVFGLLVISGFG